MGLAKSSEQAISESVNRLMDTLKKETSSEHAWPANGEHFMSKWQNEKGLPEPTQYRTCIHPECDHMESRPAPRG